MGLRRILKDRPINWQDRTNYSEEQQPQRQKNNKQMMMMTTRKPWQ
ncbi:MAG: hypothetical protein WA421_17640 [Nitrososphaeraceae archaeon]